MHSFYSDGSPSPVGITLEALYCFMDFSSLTDHNTIEGAILTQKLLKKYPSHADIYKDLGLAYCMLRNYINEKAINSFQRALEINPEFEKAQRNFKLSSYERTGSEIFLKAITLKDYDNGKIKNQENQNIKNFLVTKIMED